MPYVAPSTRSAGEFIDENDWNQDIVDNQNAAFPVGVAAWPTYTPTWTQSATVTKTVNRAAYQRIGRLITFDWYLTATGAGTANNPILVGLPVPAAASYVNIAVIGTAQFFDASSGDRFILAACINTGLTTMSFLAADSRLNILFGNSGAVFAAAIASSDIITGRATYEAAS